MEENNTLDSYTFRDASLEALAYTHPSCNLPSGDNQRLEFLGDAVLDLVIATALYKKLSDSDEGVLDRARASLVNGKSLAAKAKALGVHQRIQVSDSQRKHHPQPSNSMLEDALEALIGAIYLDGGLEPARIFITTVFAKELEAIEADDKARNAKSRLQEWSQKNFEGEVPDYELVNAEGPDHRRRYESVARLNGKEIGRGTGSSKKAAESAAAEAALEVINQDA